MKMGRNDSLKLNKKHNFLVKRISCYHEILFYLNYNLKKFKGWSVPGIEPGTHGFSVHPTECENSSVSIVISEV